MEGERKKERSLKALVKYELAFILLCWEDLSYFPFPSVSTGPGPGQGEKRKRKKNEVAHI